MQLTCVSFNCSAFAISIRRARVKYLLKWNSFSNSVSCLLVKFVRPVLLPFISKEFAAAAAAADPVTKLKSKIDRISKHYVDYIKRINSILPIIELFIPRHSIDDGIEYSWSGGVILGARMKNKEWTLK